MTRSRRRSQDDTLAPRSIDCGPAQKRDSSPRSEYGRQPTAPLSPPQYFPLTTGPSLPEGNSESRFWELPRADQNPGAGTEVPSAQSRLTSLALKFIDELRWHDFMRFEKFLNDNKEILREEGADQMCFDAAAAAMEEDDRPRARSCVEMGILVSACKKMHGSEHARFFERLSEGEKATAKGFYQACLDRETEIADQVRSRAREPVPTSNEELRLANLIHDNSQTTDSDGGSDASTVRGATEAETLQQIGQTPRSIIGPDPQSTVSMMITPRQLSTLGHLFTEIPESKYDECRKFLERYSDRLDFSDSQLIDEANRRLTAGDRRRARRCVQQSLLLQRWRSTQNPAKLFDALNREGSSEMVTLLRDFDTAYLDLQRHIYTTSTEVAPKNSNTGSVSRSDPTRQATTEQFGKRSLFGAPQGSQISQSICQPKLGWEPSGIGPAVSEISRSVSRPAASVPDPSYFDRKSQVRRSQFYTFGRVFALVWHEAAHSLDTDQASSEETARFGGPVFSYVRRMAVVKTGHGYCWCLPMSTYGGRGLSKPGLNPQDINDHAIIHMEGQTPRRLPSEPTTEKRPISVRPSSRDQRFPLASRINFAKLHTVEFSVKTIDVGMISDESLSDFRRYFRDQLDSR